MITVEIKIDHDVLLKCTAIRSGEMKEEKHKYNLDDGREIYHNRKNGAVALACIMLQGLTIGGERNG
ncbi:hypothetical protein LCGC14_2219150 [marine sediment metagenome]|uniref:Uncharacterized protein n=1 Tax=marine sediment metagenome TaxID=412755 RepID=A0A0F9DBM5_9ZZZZ